MLVQSVEWISVWAGTAEWAWDRAALNPGSWTGYHAWGNHHKLSVYTTKHCVLHGWGVNLTLQEGTLPVLDQDMQTWQMIYLVSDLLSRSIQEGVCPEGWCAWRRTTAVISSTDLQAWKTRCLAIDSLQLKWWCVWCIRDKKLDSKLINKMPVIPGR